MSIVPKPWELLSTPFSSRYPSILPNALASIFSALFHVLLCTEEMLVHASAVKLHTGKKKNDARLIAEFIFMLEIVPADSVGPVYSILKVCERTNLKYLNHGVIMMPV